MKPSFNSKYGSIEAMINDRSYCSWLLKQPWFKTRREYIIVASFSGPYGITMVEVERAISLRASQYKGMNAYEVLCDDNKLLDDGIEFINRQTDYRYTNSEIIRFLRYYQDEFEILFLVESTFIEVEEMRMLYPGTLYDVRIDNIIWGIDNFISGQYIIDAERKALEWRRFNKPNLNEKIYYEVWCVNYLEYIEADDDDENVDLFLDLSRDITHFAHRNKDLIVAAIEQMKHKANFNRVIEQLHYHPKFMSKNIDRFDNFEDFFESMGY